MTVENHSKKASDSIVLTGSKEDLKVLLIKRKYDPYKGLWAFRGGFIENGEGAGQASKRELLEETGLDLKNSTGVPLSVRKKEGRDPRGMVESFPFLFYDAHGSFHFISFICVYMCVYIYSVYIIYNVGSAR